VDLSSLPPLRDVIAAHELRARKALGQNFLLDLNITAKIARCAGDLSALTVFEVGPGPGGLTRGLLTEGAGRVIAVEYDPRAVAALAPLVQAAEGKLTVIAADALHTDLTTLADGPRAIVANLPYNIATPLLIGWLKQIYDDAGAYAHMTLMFQREVVDRITASPNSKAYGRLAVITQWLCAAQRVFDLPPEAFSPPPSVTSSIARFVPLSAQANRPAFATMEKLTAAAFGQRRKMLRAALRGFPGILEEAGIDGTLRAEQLPVSDFIKLASALDRAKGNP